jgi:molybdopterin-guanine dinucleotide biosynthesis protein B
VKAVGFVGLSGSGKTTLIERLIPLLARRGLTVSALKHAHHGFDIDRPGKDSFRFRAAGAAQVMIAAPERWALMTELRGQAAGFDQLLTELAPCDLVLVEGFRSEGSIPRLEVVGPSFALRASEGKPSFPLLGTEDLSSEAPGAQAPGAKEDPNLIAVVCDDPVDRALPRFARDDVAAIAAFIVQHLGIE